MKNKVLEVGNTVAINRVELNNGLQEEVFQFSQETSSNTSLDYTEADLNNTIIQDEDFSDLD